MNDPPVPKPVALRQAAPPVVLISVALLAVGCGDAGEPGTPTAEPPGTPDRPGAPTSVEELGPPVTESPFGKPFTPAPETEESAERVRAADEALAADPDDVDLIVEAAQARAATWRYNQAIELFTRGLEVDDSDWRLYRHRGHRFISTRRLDWAIEDLERAVQLDPYGFNSSYHLGLAYFLAGRFEDAAAEYGRCLALASDEEALELEANDRVPGDERSCMSLAEDDDTLVALLEWHYRALRRAGHHEEARALLERVEEGMEVEDNTSYYDTLLFYKGLRTEDEILDVDGLEGNEFATKAFGVANWHLVEGDEERAMELIRRIVDGGPWNAFGYIAAEAELLRAEGR